MLPIMEGSGKKIWEDFQSGALKGAITDLSVSSPALQNLSNSMESLSWTPIVGVSYPGFFAHDGSLIALWTGLSFLCDRVPDDSFIYLKNKLPIFDGENDRIVSAQSQIGGKAYFYKISGVDHLTVLGDTETVNRVKEILEKP
jgi:hypothetical protein